MIYIRKGKHPKPIKSPISYTTNRNSTENSETSSTHSNTPKKRKRYGGNFFKNLPVKYFNPKDLPQLNKDVVKNQFNDKYLKRPNHLEKSREMSTALKEIKKGKGGIFADETNVHRQNVATLRSTNFDEKLNYTFKSGQDRIEKDTNTSSRLSKRSKNRSRGSSSSLASSIRSVMSKKEPETRVDIENWNLDMYKKRMEN